MNREDFTEGSVSQTIFDFWEGKHPKDLRFILLNRKTKRELVDFIIEAQSKGRFGGGYIHD